VLLISVARIYAYVCGHYIYVYILICKQTEENVLMILIARVCTYWFVCIYVYVYL